MKNREYTVSDAILDTLKAHGVNTIFGYPGGTVIPFYDVLKDHSEIQHVLVRNEQGAAFAASGFARSTKKIGVCIGTSGPGATNLVTGIADAYLDSVPILCFTGQVPLGVIGKDAFQEVDMTGITLNITKHNYIVYDPSKIVKIVTEAIKVATSGRPGPVHIDLPKDMQSVIHPKKFSIPDIKLHYDPQMKAYKPLKKSLIENIVTDLKKAKKPLLLIGHGVKLSSAETEINKLINFLKIPTVHTLLGKGILPETQKYNLGMLGMHGFYHCNMATFNADFIINIGSRFDDRIVGTYDSFQKGKKIVHVDIDDSELNKLIDTDYPVHSDAKQFINELLQYQKISKLNIKNWWEQIYNWQKEKPYEKETKFFSVRNGLNGIMKEVNKNQEQFIIVTDVGQHQMWAALSCTINNSLQWLSSGGAGTMGFSLPNSIGAAFANKNKTIICIVGDGSLQMNIQELQLLKHHNLNIKVCVFNNNYLGMVRQWQDLFYEKNYSGVEISSPDYIKLAEAYGIKGYRITADQDIPKNHNQIFSSKGPCLIEYCVEKEDNVLPMVQAGKTLNDTMT